MIAETTAAAEAQKIMAENSIRHLPVVADGKKLVGLVTRQSLALQTDKMGSLNIWEISRYLTNLTAGKLMTKNVRTITPDMTVERAARMMMEQKIGCLVVVEDDIVMGILSEIDLLRAFQLMLGLPEKGIRVTMRMPNRQGEFAKLTGALGNNGIGVMGIGTYPTPKQDGSYDAVLKIRNVTAEKARAVLSQVPDQELIDIREDV
jgi:acetoin utilization protein AcuB